MGFSKVLEFIEQAGVEETKLLLDAVVKRREQFLNGGIVVYGEYSKEEVGYYEELFRCVREISEEENESDEELE